VEKDLDDEALLILAFEVASTTTIQLLHHCPYVRFIPTNRLRDYFSGCQA
jgi:hypothetical protein